MHALYSRTTFSYHIKKVCECDYELALVLLKYCFAFRFDGSKPSKHLLFAMEKTNLSFLRRVFLRALSAEPLVFGDFLQLVMSAGKMTSGVAAITEEHRWAIWILQDEAFAAEIELLVTIAELV